MLNALTVILALIGVAALGVGGVAHEDEPLAAVVAVDDGGQTAFGRAVADDDDLIGQVPPHPLRELRAGGSVIVTLDALGFSRQGPISCAVVGE